MEHQPDQLAARLRERRLAAGLSQSALARMAGVSQPYIAQLEGGRRELRSIALLRAISSALGIDYRTLLPPP